jgi:hypothetical protein
MMMMMSLRASNAPCTLQMDLRKCVRCVLVHPHRHHCKSGGADFTFTLHNLHEQSSYGVMDDPSAHGHVCYYRSAGCCSFTTLENVKSLKEMSTQHCDKHKEEVSSLGFRAVKSPLYLIEYLPSDQLPLCCFGASLSTFCRYKKNIVTSNFYNLSSVITVFTLYTSMCYYSLHYRRPAMAMAMAFANKSKK